MELRQTKITLFWMVLGLNFILALLLSFYVCECV